MVRRTLGALVLTLAMGSWSFGVTLFEDDFDDNSDGTDPAGWIFNTPGGSDAGPKAQTAVQNGVVEVTGKSSSGTFVQLTPGADGTFNSYQPQSNNKLILTVDIAGRGPAPAVNQLTGAYLYASGSATSGSSDFYNFQFHSGNGTIELRERVGGTISSLASTTSATLVTDGKFTSLDLGEMNNWRLEVTHNTTSAVIELFLNDVSILSHTDNTPRDITNVTPAVYGGTGKDFRFDNVKLDAVPEPGAVGLLGLGAIAFALRRSR